VQGAGESLFVGVLSNPGAVLVVVLLAEVDRARAAGGNDVPGPLCLEQRNDGGSGRSHARNDDPDFGELLAHHPQGVGQGR